LEDVATMDVDARIDDAGFSTRFAAKVLPLELDLGMIPPLLKSARRIYDMDRTPDRKVKCVDCQRVDELVRLAG
jgi:hypothetical protein